MIRLRILFFFSVLISLVLAACGNYTQKRSAQSVTAQPIPDFCKEDQSGDQFGNWIIGTWHNKYTDIKFHRKGEEILWTVDRQRHSTANYGTKAAMKASGVVEKLSPCAVIMKGKYDESESEYIVGKPAEYRFVLDNQKILSGTFKGAQNIWVPMGYLRKK